MADSSIAVSVVIRVRNEGAYLRRTLEALKAQEGPPAEVIVVDNDSTDDSRQLALSAGAIVLHLPKAEFTYGRAQNFGIQSAKGEIVVLLSAHSMPIGAHFIQSIVKPFQDPRVAAARCIHVLNRAELLSWTSPSTIAWPIDLTSVIAQGPIGCACAIRRSVWAELPFDEHVRSVEDKFWAYEVLKRGHLLSNSNACYFYLRDFSVVEYVRKLNADRLAYFEYTGTRFEGSPQVRELLTELLYALPKRAARLALRDILLCLSVGTVPWQSCYERFRARQRQRSTDRQPVNT